MQYTLLDTKDQAEGQLDSGIGTSTLSIVLKSGEGAEFPTIYRDTTSSAGDVTTLNKTGIGASGIAVGDFIENITDGSHAFVLSVNTDSLTTTSLLGGSDNTWDNGDTYAVGRFVVTLNKRDASDQITTSEKVLVGDISGDTITVETGGRGHDSTTPAEFDSDDYVSLFVSRDLFIALKKAYAEAFEQIDLRYTKAETNALLASKNTKDPVTCKTTANVDLAGGGLANGTTHDGIVVTTGERVLVGSNTASEENGTYVVPASGAASRTTDMDSSDEFNAALVPVKKGSSNADTLWLQTTDDPVVGTDGISFSNISVTLEKISSAEAAAGTDDTKYTTISKIVYFLKNLTSGVATSFIKTRLAKTAIVASDILMLGDSAASSFDKKITFTNFLTSVKSSLFPLIIYSSSAASHSNAAVRTVTHSLSVSQADVQAGRYGVFMTAQTAGNNGVVFMFNSPNIDGLTLLVQNVWSSSDPADGKDLRWQANTLKIKNASGFNYTNARVHIVKFY